MKRRHDMLLVFRPVMMDRFCLKVFFFFPPNQLWSYAQSLPLFSLSFPLKVLALLRFFPCFHRITVYSDEIWTACLLSVRVEWRHPTTAKADLPFWPPVATWAILHLRIFPSARHTHWNRYGITQLPKERKRNFPILFLVWFICLCICTMQFDLSYCRVLWNCGLKYKKKRRKKERGMWVGSWQTKGVSTIKVASGSNTVLVPCVCVPDSPNSRTSRKRSFSVSCVSLAMSCCVRNNRGLT